MTETLNPTRETGSISPEDALANARNALKVDDLDSLRLEQKDLLDATQGTIGSVEFSQQCDELARTYLDNHGVTPSDPKYAEYLEVVRQFSYDAMSNSDWYVGQPGNSDDPHSRASGQLLLINQIQPIIFGESLDLSSGTQDDDEEELGLATTRTEPGTVRTQPVARPTQAPRNPDPSTTPVAPSANPPVPPVRRSPSGDSTVEITPNNRHSWVVDPLDTDSTVETTPGDDPDEDLELLDDGHEIERSLDLLRVRMARLSAKRQRQTGIRNKFSNKKYERIQRWYTASVIEAGRRTHEQEFQDTATTEDEKRALATQFILEEQTKLREASLELLKNTKVSKFIEWMTRGSKTARIAKGILVGGAGAAAGAGLVIASAGVSAAVIFGGALTFATRYARGYAVHDAKQGRGITATIDADSAKTKLESKFDSQNDADHFYTATGHFTDEFNKDVKLEQKKRRKTVRRAIGQLALGAGAGAAVAYASETGLIGAAIDKAQEVYENLRTSYTTGVGGNAVPASVVTVDGPSAEFPSGSSADLDTGEQGSGLGGEAGSEVNPESSSEEPSEGRVADTDGSIGKSVGEGTTSPDAPSAEASTPYEYSTDALTIKAGEGWFETFENIGVTDPGAREALLSDEGLMEQLKNMGLAYEDEKLGWGMNMTASGQMPREALDLIRESAQNHHFTLAA